MTINEDIEKDIIDHLYGNRQLKWQEWKKFISEDSKELAYLKNRYADSRSLRESLYRLKNHIGEIPRCPTCGNMCNFIGGKKGYTSHCSDKCAQNDKNVRKRYEETNLRLYGVINGAQSLQAREKYICHIRKKYHDNTIINSWQADEVKEQIKKTCLTRYGTDNWAKTRESKMLKSSHIIVEKRIDTMRKNGTLNKSMQENIACELLRQKYPDIIRQYKSNVYPFNCDFYIPSTNTYIECQFGQFHHHRPYLGTTKDLEDIKSIEEKSTRIKAKTHRTKTRYDAELETWTVRDVKKRECAKKNKLNYLEFWTLDDVKKYIENNQQTCLEY